MSLRRNQYGFFTMQTIFKTAPASNFAIFSNELVNTPMPFKAKEVLIYLLSKPKDWRVKVADIRSSLALTTHTIRRSLEWLQSAGYAGYVRLKSGHTIWKIFDKPQQETAHSPRQMPQVVLPHVAKPSDIQIQIDHKEIKKPLPAEVVTSPISAQIPESIVVVSSDELIYPAQLTEPQKKAAKHIIKKVKEPELQQPVLFALAYAITSGTVKSAPAYLQGLVTRANNGTFEPVTNTSTVKQGGKPLVPIWTGRGEIKVSAPEVMRGFMPGLRAALRGA